MLGNGDKNGKLKKFGRGFRATDTVTATVFVESQECVFCELKNARCIPARRDNTVTMILQCARIGVFKLNARVL